MNPTAQLASAHTRWLRPPTDWPGCSGSQPKFVIRALPPAGTAPLPESLYACSEVSMQEFVLPTSAGRQDARVIGAGAAAVVKAHGDGPVRPGCDLRLELVGRLPRRVHVVVDLNRRRPGQPAVGGLGELDVHARPVP